MVYDAAHAQVVLFGGGDMQWLADTWVWDGTAWTQLDPAHVPPARNYTGMAYDEARGTVVMFGGYSRSGWLGDTWTWDGADWAHRHPAHSPSPRWGAALAYDSIRDRVVLFGGNSSSDEYVDDTWAWDGTDWTQVIPAHSPSARAQPGIADDPLGHVVLFGGESSSGILGDTWTWDGNDWSRSSPAQSPPGRKWLGGMMAYDVALGQVVLFGGLGSGEYLGDTWTWDGVNWTQRFPARSPSARYYGAIADDGSHSQLVLFGGIEAGHGVPKGLLGDTWTWDGTDWTLGTAGSISLAPRTGVPGTSVEVRGWGFAAREFVRLTFADSTQGETLLTKIRADSAGAFTTQVTIPLGSAMGKQHLKARGVTSGETTRRSFTVT